MGTELKIQDFAQSPEGFIMPNGREDPNAWRVVRPFPPIPQPSRDVVQAYFKLQLGSEDPGSNIQQVYDLTWSETETDGSLSGYFLGYNGMDRPSEPCFVDIPKTVTEGPSFLFTIGLSGCSVIVTNFDDGHYRVFHDNRRYSSLLYDHVIMAMDFKDYGVAPGDMAHVFMQYRDGSWNLFGQLYDEEVTPEGASHTVPRRMPHQDDPALDKAFIVKKPDSYDAVAARTNFDQMREKNIDKLEFTSREVAGPSRIPDTQDGSFQAFEGLDFPRDFVEESPAVERSVALQDVIRERYEVFQRSIEKIIQNAREHGTGSGKLDELPGLVRDHWKFVGTYLSNSQNLNSTYLWLLQKEAKGINAVVFTDEHKKASFGGTVGERLVNQQLDPWLAFNADYVSGFNDHQHIQIPGFANDMSLLEMMTLFDMSPQLTQNQKGALVHYISEKAESQWRDKVWDQTEKIVGMFQDAGASTKPMPQDLLLHAVRDEYGGRCYPLVRAMAVALSRSVFAVDQLNAKLVALKSEDNLENARIFRNCLRDLHSSFLAARASTTIGRTNVKDAMKQLEVQEGERKFFALNTESHSMLLGATNDGGTTSYHFYDPNFAVATFSSQDELLTAVTKFFTELDYARIYEAGGTDQDPVFTLVSIDTKKMGDIQFDYPLTVRDFVEAETLTEIINIKKESGLDLPASDRFTKNPSLHIGAGVLEAAGLAEAWNQATMQLEETMGLGKNWMPILATLEEEGTGYRVQFINLEDPSERKWLSTEDPAVKEFKSFLDDRLEAIRKAYEFEGGTFIERDSVPEGEATDGLAAMFLVKVLIENFSGRKDQEDGSGKLAVALKVHSYLNLTQLGQQALGDVVKVAQLTETIIRSEEAAQSSLTIVGRAFGRVSEGVGLVLGAANVVFDAYELSNAQNEIQKAVFGTQLAFDSASFLAGVGSAGAGMIGASTAAAVLGGITVVLTGIAIGATVLAANYSKIAEDAQAVGRYFGKTKEAYEGGGYEYDKEHQMLIPLVGAVIKSVDLSSGSVEYDSQYIYPTRHGATVFGNTNWILYDSPHEVHDRNQAINVREGIKLDPTHHLMNVDSFTTLVLPVTPKSYINYSYQTLPFATARHDYGFDVLRKLEDGDKFTFDFYIFPSEYIIRSISHEYVDTPVTIQLTKRAIRLEVPELPSAMQNHLNYTLIGVGADYTIGMRQGVSFTLTSEDDSSNSTRWILDCRDLIDLTDLTNKTVPVDTNGLTVAGIHVALAAGNVPSVLILARKGGIAEVDFAQGTVTLVEENMQNFPGKSDALATYLDDLNKKHLLHGSFIIVDNYTEPSGTVVGRAFYDVAHERFLYTTNAPESLTTTVQLGGVVHDNEVYFYSTENDGLWKVDPSTGKCLAKYSALYPSSMRHLMRVWEEGDRVLAVYRHMLNPDESEHGDLTYVLGSDNMTLVSATGDTNLLKKLDDMDRFSGSLETLLKMYENVAIPPTYPSDDLSGKTIEADFDPHMLYIYGKDDNDTLHHYWLRLKDGAVIKPNLKPSVDIVFAGTIIAPLGGKEEFCFYSRSDQAIYLQTGTGTSTSDPQTITIAANFGKLSNVIQINTKLFAITDSGYIFRITTTGSLFLEAVNSRWFDQFESGTPESPWWKALKDIAQNNLVTIVSVFGLEDQNKAVISVWYYNGRMVVAAHSLHGKQIQLLGLVKGGHEAWLCHWDAEGHGHLFRQPLVPEDDLNKIFAANTHDVNSDNIPEAIEVLKGHAFKNVIMTANGLQCTTTDGIILILRDEDSITLYGVDKSWEKNHFTSLEDSLAKLTQEWVHGEVVVLQGLLPTVTPAWYIVSAAKVVTVDLNAKITWADNPVWLGVDIDGAAGYFYLQARGKLCSINLNGETTEMATLTMAKRFDQLLMFGITETPFSLPALMNVKFTMTSQTQGGSADYTIIQPTWDAYEASVLQVQAASSPHGNVTMTLKDKSSRTLLVRQAGDDLVIIDNATGNSATIRKAFAAGQNYDNIRISTDLGTTLSVASIQNAQRRLKDKAQVDPLPYIPLALIDYLEHNPDV